jgi:hypothetical protein
MLWTLSPQPLRVGIRWPSRPPPAPLPVSRLGLGGLAAAAHRAIVESLGDPHHPLPSPSKSRLQNGASLQQHTRVYRRGPPRLSWGWPLPPRIRHTCVCPLPPLPKERLRPEGCQPSDPVPPAWSRTTSTASSTRWLRGYCTPIPDEVRYVSPPAARSAERTVTIPKDTHNPALSRSVQGRSPQRVRPLEDHSPSTAANASLRSRFPLAVSSSASCDPPAETDEPTRETPPLQGFAPSPESACPRRDETAQTPHLPWASSPLQGSAGSLDRRSRRTCARKRAAGRLTPLGVRHPPQSPLRFDSHTMCTRRRLEVCPGAPLCEARFHAAHGPS